MMDHNFEAFHTAIAQGDIEKVNTYFIQHNFSSEKWINLRLKVSGKTALQQAVCADKNSEALVNLLLEHNADPNIQNEKGLTALHYAVWKGYTSIAKVLLAECANPNLQDLVGHTVLHHAVNRNDVEWVKIFLEAEPDVNHQDPNWMHLSFAASEKTALQQTVCIDKNSEALVNLLLEHNADPNIQNEKGLTALHYAVWKGYASIVKILLAGCANPNLQNSGGGIALHYAVGRNDVELVKILLDAEAEIDHKELDWINLRLKVSGKTALQQAVCADKNSEALVNLLLEHNPNPNIQNAGGWTALHYAVWKGYTSIAKVLLARCANPNLQNVARHTALHYAVDRNNIELVKILLDAKAEVDHKDLNWKTALHSASWNKNTPIVRELLANNADSNIKHRCGLTALHIVTQQGNIKLLPILLSYGANVNIQNNNQCTPLDLVKQKILGSGSLSAVHERFIFSFLAAGAQYEVGDFDSLPMLKDRINAFCVSLYGAFDHIKYCRNFSIVERQLALRFGSKIIYCATTASKKIEERWTDIKEILKEFFIIDEILLCITQYVLIGELSDTLIEHLSKFAQYEVHGMPHSEYIYFTQSLVNNILFDTRFSLVSLLNKRFHFNYGVFDWTASEQAQPISLFNSEIKRLRFLQNEEEKASLSLV